MIEIIPAIDIIEGKCVRLSQGDYVQSKIYSENPVDVAKAFESHGIRRLHLVDLDGAKAQHIVNHKTLLAIATQTSLTIDFGGGLKTDNDLRAAFECGASMVTGGSVAVKNKELFLSWLQTYGSEKIILGADVKNGQIAVSGWTEKTDLPLIPFLSEYKKHSVTQVICTDIEKDGMLQGASVELYKTILSEVPNLFLIASGGVSSWNDINALESAQVPAVITGKAIYEGHITLKEIEKRIIRI